MSRLTVCLLLVLIIGSSLAEVDTDEQAPQEGAELEVDSESGTTQVEAKQLGDLAAEDKSLKDEELKQKEAKVDDPRPEDKQVEDKELKDVAIEDQTTENTDLQDKEEIPEETPKPVKNCQKTHSTRLKHKETKTTRNKHKQLHPTKSKLNEEDSTETDDSAEDYSGQVEDDETDLNREICLNALSQPQVSFPCCHPQMLLDKDANTCVDLEKSNAFTSRSEKKTLRAALRLVNCLSRRKKYIKSGRTDRLNMKRIRADADKLGDPEQAEFMVRMYKTCAASAKDTVTNFKAHPRRANGDLHTAHDVFQLVLYACVDSYLEQHECPHFHWFGMSASNQLKCDAWAKECERLVGY